MATAGRPGDIFGPLLERPAFRADLLYFIRLAGNYAASIFIDVRNRAPMHHRHALDVFITGHAGNDTQLLAALTNRHAWFDALKADFTILLGEMPQYMKDRLERALTEDHLLPWDRRNFIKALDDLREYRHFLEHPEKRINVTDERLLETLGRMLLPFLGNHLAGRVHHHGRRSGMRNARAAAEQTRTILADALAARRETSKFMNGLKRRVSHDEIAAELTRKRGSPPHDAAVHKIAKARKKERADLECRKAAMLTLHRSYFNETSWPRYNHENFLMRFAFIGKRRILDLENKLQFPADRHDFIHAIEPFFILSMDMALIIHCWLTELEGAGVPIRNRKELAKVTPAAAWLPDIRNAIAHGGWIWAVEPKDRSSQPLSFAELVASLLAALHHPKVARDGAKWRNDLLTRMEGALRPCGWHHIYAKAQPDDDPNQMRAHHVIKRWTAKTRARYADRYKWHVEKRPYLRRVAATWMRDLRTLANPATASGTKIEKY